MRAEESPFEFGNLQQASYSQFGWENPMRRDHIFHFVQNAERRTWTFEAEIRDFANHIFLIR